MTLTAEQIRDIIFEMGGTPPQALEEAVKDKNGYSELPPHRYSAVSECYFGPGSRHMLVDSLQSRNIKKVLIITDKGLVKSGMIDEFREALAEDSIQSAVFSDVEPNPTTETVEAGVAALHRCRPECLLAIGGGSPIDTAKAINILAFNGGKISDYEGVNRSQERGLPLAALPTTAGTGSETTDFYVITDKVRHSKMVMVDHHCQVKIAAIDPELMLGMPPHLTAATGMDAMTHAVEACLSVRSNPMTDRDATFAIREIREALPVVFQDGKNVNGRSRMAYAQFSAGQSFANAGLGLVHAMAHALGGRFNLPHGLCNAVILPVVLEFYSQYAQVHRDFSTLAAALGIPDISKLSGADCAAAVVADIHNLNQILQIPTALDLKGAKSEDLSALADLALRDTCLPDSPVKPTHSQIIGLYRKIMK